MKFTDNFLRNSSNNSTNCNSSKIGIKCNTGNKCHKGNWGNVGNNINSVYLLWMEAIMCLPQIQHFSLWARIPYPWSSYASLMESVS